MNRKSLVARIALHSLAALVAIALLLAGGAKLSGAEEMVANFARWGFPVWFVYVVGASEIVGALLLALPKTRFFGAALLVNVMIGAVMTHVVAGEAAQTVPALVLGSLTAVHLVAERDTLKLLIARFRPTKAESGLAEAA